MDIAEHFGSYLKADDLPQGQDVSVTIDRVILEDLNNNGKTEQKPVVYFRGKNKGLVLNRTNAESISRLYGGETDAWAGKAIALYIDPHVVVPGGGTKPGIRIRPVAPAASGAATGAPPPAPPPPQAGAALPVSSDQIPF